MEGGSVMSSKKHYTQQEKLEVLKTAGEVGVVKASELAGVHYTTVYDWRKQLNVLGERAFVDYVPSTVGRGVKRISQEKERAVLEMWERYPGYGPSQVRNQLRRGGVTISVRTVERIMKAKGYRGIRKRRGTKEGTRFEATRPLELVQMDILEYYIHKVRVYIILLLDDFSRFLLGYRVASAATIDEVIGAVRDAIDRYGKMEELLTDRGFVFYSWRGVNRFEHYLEMEGIYHTHARSRHPKTLGKVEAVNRQLQKELLRRREFVGVSEASEGIGSWVEEYNYRRTHQGLGGLLVPADRFHGRAGEVARCLSEKLDPGDKACYSVDDVSRSVLSLALSPDGTLTCYLFGHALEIGGIHERASDPGGGRDLCKGAEDSKGERAA
jgi:transposase InsO family protein